MIYLTKKPKISLLLIEKVIILAEYSDFRDVFFNKSTKVFLLWTRANEYAIKLEKS